MKPKKYIGDYRNGKAEATAKKASIGITVLADQTDDMKVSVKAKDSKTLYVGDDWHEHRLIYNSCFGNGQNRSERSIFRSDG